MDMSLEGLRGWINQKTAAKPVVNPGTAPPAGFQFDWTKGDPASTPDHAQSIFERGTAAGERMGNVAYEPPPSMGQRAVSSMGDSLRNYTNGLRTSAAGAGDLAKAAGTRAMGVASTLGKVGTAAAPLIEGAKAIRDVSSTNDPEAQQGRVGEAAVNVAGAGVGSLIGGGIGALGGPAAPVTVPLGAAVGSWAGSHLNDALSSLRGVTPWSDVIDRSRQSAAAAPTTATPAQATTPQSDTNASAAPTQPTGTDAVPTNGLREANDAILAKYNQQQSDTGQNVAASRQPNGVLAFHGANTPAGAAGNVPTGSPMGGNTGNTGNGLPAGTAAMDDKINGVMADYNRGIGNNEDVMSYMSGHRAAGHVLDKLSGMREQNLGYASNKYGHDIAARGQDLTYSAAMMGRDVQLKQLQRDLGNDNYTRVTKDIERRHTSLDSKGKEVVDQAGVQRDLDQIQALAKAKGTDARFVPQDTSRVLSEDIGRTTDAAADGPDFLEKIGSKIGLRNPLPTSTTPLADSAQLKPYKSDIWGQPRHIDNNGVIYSDRKLMGGDTNVFGHVTSFDPNARRRLKEREGNN